MTSNDDLMKLDLFEILGVGSEADDKEISKAYRKLALKCHPDKNPDKKAHEEFKRLGKILDLLCDPAKRATYDQGWKAKKAAAERVRHLDSKRRKMKDELEERERAHAEKQSSVSSKVRVTTVASAEQERIERLREEGLRLLESERKQGSSRRSVQLNRHIKAKWDVVHSEDSGYSEVILKKVFQKYGQITSIKLIGKSTAIIEFSSRDSALHSLQELGHVENPLDLELLDDVEMPASAEPVVEKEVVVNLKRPAPTPLFDASSFADFEAETLQRLMAAASQQQKKD